MGSHLPRPLLWILLAVRLVAASSAPPPVPEPQRSPAVLFRQLLAATASQRSELLASKPEPARTLIVAKLKEFEALPPDQRELRLQVAQLQFYLSPLLRAPATVRSNRLERVPPEDRPLLEERLQAWDALPEDTRREILETERSLSYFVRQESADPRKLAALLEQVPAPARPEIEAQFARWSSLPAEERARKAAHFSRFFDLSGPERDKTLSRLPDVERQQMERTLAKFSSLPPGSRHSIEPRWMQRLTNTRIAPAASRTMITGVSPTQLVRYWPGSGISTSRPTRFQVSPWNSRRCSALAISGSL